MLTDSKALAWLDDGTPTVVIAGCGVSMGGTTPAPGVSDFLDPTLDLLEQHAQFHNPIDAKYRQPSRLFPEAVYGAIGEAFDTTEQLRVWSSLDKSTAVDIGAVPSVGHAALVHLSATQGWPIITTNFDCLFEAAADALGLQLQPQVPTNSDRLSIPTLDGQAILVKIHGTADDYTTVRSTAADLSRCSLILERMQFAKPPQRALVVGYSGRDFDVFPWLAEHFSGRDVLWIDRSFHSDHRARTLGRRVHLWEGPWDQLAETIVSWRPPESARSVGSEWSDRAKGAVNEHVGSLLAQPSREAIGAMVGVLVATGAHLDAAELSKRANEINEITSRIQTLLWGAHANASIDQFERAELMARAARRLAWRFREPYGAGRAAVAISYARVSNCWLTVLPGLPRKGWFRVQSLLSLTCVAWVSAAYAPMAAITIARLRRARVAPRTAEYRFATEYLEHLVRLMALLDGLRTVIPLSARVLDGVWRAIQRTCANVGYTWGVFNVTKFLSRHLESFGFTEPKGAVTRSDALGDLVGQVIARRDAAKWLIDRGQQADRVQALRLLDEAANLAQLLRCPSLVLKICVIQHSVDGRLFSRSHVHQWIRGFGGKGLKADSSRLFALLCSPDNNITLGDDS